MPRSRFVANHCIMSNFWQLIARVECGAEAAANITGNNAQPKDHDDRSAALSIARSGKMFQSVQESMGTQAKQQIIGDLGAQEQWRIGLDALQSPKMPQILWVGGFDFVVLAYFHGAAVVVKTHMATGT